MPFPSEEQVCQRLAADGRCSSHFVWLIARLSFFEASNGWIFGFLQKAEVTLLALEPLIPGAPKNYGGREATQFQIAWDEFCRELKPKISVFVSVYSEFFEVLKRYGFQGLKVGEEPWVDLSDCVPKGNKGKGVRSARNQALYAGVRVQELAKGEVQNDVHLREKLQNLIAKWQQRHLLRLDGFLNQVDPFSYPDCKKYYIARNAKSEFVGFLAATPVPSCEGYYLEDLILSPDAPKGTSELLTIEAMLSLKDAGFREASLGIVSVLSADLSVSHRLPKSILKLMRILPKYLKRIYRFGGLEIFRKRFKPQRWENIFIAVRNESDRSDTRAWISSLISIFRAFEPKLGISMSWALQWLTQTLKRYPLTLAVALASSLTFALINHFGELPPDTLAQYGFSGTAPVSQWLMRSITSDYLYFDRPHFFIWGCLFFYVVKWSEKSHSRNFIVPFLISISVFDDFINYALIISPFKYFHPIVFRNLIEVKDVGGSLILVTLLGLQLCQFNKNREIMFALISLALVLGFAFDAGRFQGFILNMNHFLFLVIGYIVGKTRFEYLRNKNKRASKGKAPIREMRTVVLTGK